MEQRTATAAVAETETGSSESAVETPEIAAGENLTKKSEGKYKVMFDNSFYFLFSKICF